MNSHFATKVGKILSRQKTPDRYTLVSIFKPKSQVEREHGVLYFVLEILSPDPAMAKVAKLIESTIIETYYQKLGNGFDSFERALKITNEALADLAEEGEVGWIGKINGVIAALEGNMLHITQTGTVEGYMVRNGSITHVTENLSSAADKPNPIKTFVNIASGDLEIGDRVIISTAELFYHFSVDDLRRITSKFSPATSASNVVKMLRKEEIESINTLILELTTSEEEETTDEEMPDEIALESTLTGGAGANDTVDEWLGSNNSWQKYASQGLLFAKSVIKLSAKGLQKSKETYDERLAPHVNKFGQEASKRVGEKLNELTKKDAQDVGAMSEKKQVPQQNLFEDAPRRSIFTPALKVVKSSQEFVGSSPKRSQFFITAAIGLIAILVLSGIYSFQKRNVEQKRSEIVAAYESIQTKTEGAIKAHKLGDSSKAKTLLSEAKDDIKKIADSSYLANDITALASRIDGAIEDIFNIRRFDDLTPLVDFSTLDESIKLSGLYKNGATVISFDKERHDAVVYKTDTGIAEHIPTAIFNGTIVGLTPTNDLDTVVAIANDPDGIYVYDTRTKGIAAATQGFTAEWPRAAGIDTYFGNIYLLVPGDNQIYKYPPAGGASFGGGSGYILDTTKVDLSDAVDIAIDSSVYILKKDGTILQFLSGELTDFAVYGTPSMSNEGGSEKSTDQMLLSPIKIVTNGDMQRIYVADKGGRKIVVFDKDGEYQTQYVSEKFTDIRDIWVEDGVIYVLSGSAVYEVRP